MKTAMIGLALALAISPVCAGDIVLNAQEQQALLGRGQAFDRCLTQGIEGPRSMQDCIGIFNFLLLKVQAANAPAPPPAADQVPDKPAEKPTE